MPKLTIEFDHNDALDREEHLFMIKAKDFYFAMQDLDAWLLRNTEYGLADDFKDQNQQEVEKALSVVRAKLAHYLKARDVSLDMLS